MQEETILVSLRIPKSMDRDMGFRVKSGGYASRTELMREALREKLYKNLEEMRGALKGKVKVTGSMREWRNSQWQKALKKAKGDVRVAFGIMEKEEKKALKNLRL